MYYCFKNCCSIWSFALGGCPLEEASEHNFLLLNTSTGDFSLGLSILSCVHLCSFSKSSRLTTLHEFNLINPNHLNLFYIYSTNSQKNARRWNYNYNIDYKHVINSIVNIHILLCFQYCSKMCTTISTWPVSMKMT